MTREEKLISLYKSCLENDYIDMSDETQQLKVKVFAMDLKLKYKDVTDLYNEAKELYEKAERIKAEEAVVGEKILILTDDEKVIYYIYKRPNGSVYCRRSDDDKKCSFHFEACPKKVLNSTYHPSKTIYTGASSGSVSMGGVHQTEAYYTQSASNTNKGEVVLICQDKKITLSEIQVTIDIGKLYKHDKCFENRFVKNKARCILNSTELQRNTFSATMSQAVSYEEKLSMASYLSNELYLEFFVCQELVEFLNRVCNGVLPEQDEDIYIRAKKLAESDKKSDLVTSKELFEKIGDYKDSITQVENLSGKIIEAGKREEEQLQLEKERLVLKKEAQAKRNKKLAVIISPIVAVVLVFVIVLTTVIIPNGKYNKAVALMEAEKYEEAAVAFEALNGHKDSAEKIKECNNAILDIKYNDAVALMDAGKVFEAYDAFLSLESYKDSAEKAKAIYDNNIVLGLSVANVGDYVSFGAYEQDNNTSNGNEKIEWLVLEKTDGKALVISRYALDFKPYNDTLESVNWETCDIRVWLNNDFINNAFSENDKEMISTVTVSADKNPRWAKNPGAETQDKVFLLSTEEANRYFSSDDSRKCEPTAYADAIVPHAYNSESCSWILRSTDSIGFSFAFVDTVGDITDYSGCGVNYLGGVRPAIWIEFE